MQGFPVDAMAQVANAARWALGDVGTGASNNMALLQILDQFKSNFFYEQMKKAIEDGESDFNTEAAKQTRIQLEQTQLLKEIRDTQSFSS